MYGAVPPPGCINCVGQLANSRTAPDCPLVVRPGHSVSFERQMGYRKDSYSEREISDDPGFTLGTII